MVETRKPSIALSSWRSGMRILLLLCLLAFLVGLAWWWRSQLPDDAEGMAAVLSEFRQVATGLPVGVVIATVLVASVVAVPLGVIIVVTALLFGTWLGMLYTLVGAMLGGIVSYAVGNALGHDGLKRFAGERINQVSQRLAKRGVLSVVIIRLLPLAPFAIVNMIAGASHLRLRDFIIGTAIGMLPGILIIALSVGELQAWWLSVRN